MPKVLHVRVEKKYAKVYTETVWDKKVDYQNLKHLYLQQICYQQFVSTHYLLFITDEPPEIQL